MSELYTRFDSAFFEKTRLSLLTIVYQEEKVSFNQLKQRLGGTDGSIYSHLEKLIKAGYLVKQKDIVGSPQGATVQTIYQITGSGRKAFREYLAFLEEMISGMRTDRV